MCYIPTILRRHRIMGKNRKEPSFLPTPVVGNWIERPTEWVKITPFGEISLQKVLRK